MKLPDRIQPLDADHQPVGDPLPAHVGTTSAGTEDVPTGTGQIVRLVEELRALVRPTELATPGRFWEWRGTVYKQAAAPLVRRRGGRDHHFTIRLEVVEA